MTAAEVVRSAAIVFAVIAGIGFLLIARVVRNARKWGCFMGILAAISITGGNVQRFREPLTIWPVFGICAMCCGLIYVAKVTSEPGWREKNRPTH